MHDPTKLPGFGRRAAVPRMVQARRTSKNNASGFTIVELLIVIVVIGVLAAITIVAYNGIQQRARETTVKSDLANAARKMAADNALNGSYALTAAAVDGGQGLPASSGTSYQFQGTGATYCLTGTNGNISFKVSDAASSPSPGGCPGDGVGGLPAISNLQINPQLALNTSQFATQTPAGNSASRSVSGGPNGEPTYDVTTTVSGQLRIAFKASGTSFPVLAGEQYNLSIYLNSTVSMSSANIEINFQSPSTYVLFPIGNVATGWNRYSAVAAVPAGMTSISSAQLISAASVPASATFKMTKVQITKGPTLYNFADGSSPGWVWNGASNASTSTGPQL